MVAAKETADKLNRARVQGEIHYFRVYRLASREADTKNRGSELMAEVRLHEGETIENALRRFKRKVVEKDVLKRLSGEHII